MHTTPVSKTVQIDRQAAQLVGRVESFDAIDDALDAGAEQRIEVTPADRALAQMFAGGDDFAEA
jgi:hypothetical protein